MINRRLVFSLLFLFCLQTAWAEADFAPSVPDLSLPAEAAAPAAPAARANAAPAPKQTASKTAPKKAAPKKAAASKTSARRTAKKPNTPPVTNTAAKVNNEEIVVQNLLPQGVQPVPAVQTAALAAPAQPARQTAPSAPALPASAAQQTGFVPARETAPAAGGDNAMQVSYNPPTDRDPTLSPDDTLLLKHREQERLRAIEMERQRKLEAERRRLAEIERQRQLELERLRDPSREIRGKIRVNGIIGQEVFIGNKVYTVGKTVLGARIVRVLPDSVVFMYKGQKFTKKVQLQ